jgi:hypothetical protein
MASVAGTSPEGFVIGGESGMIFSTSPRQGKVVKANYTHRRRSSAAGPFVAVIRELARNCWPKLSAGVQAEWREPFGPASWTRNGSLVSRRHGWQNFVTAHFFNVYFRGRYIESDPGEMPITLSDFAITDVDWGGRSVDVEWTLHFYNPPDACCCVELYQFRPGRLSETNPYPWAKKVSIFLNVDGGQEDYSATLDFVFPCDPGQNLRLLARCRSYGGHDQGRTTQEQRP